MPQQFFQHNPETLWSEQKNIIAECLSAARSFFGGAWLPDSLWHWLEFFSEEMEEMTETDISRARKDRDGAFFVAMVGQIDFLLLLGVTKQLDSIRLQITGDHPVAKQEARASVDIQQALRSLDIQERAVDALLNLLQAFSARDRGSLAVSLGQLANAYGEVSVAAELAAAALRYYRPEKPFVDFVSFHSALGTAQTLDWIAVMRFLGEAFAGSDAETRKWAVFTMLTNPVDQSFFATGVARLYFMMILHIGWSDFPSLLTEDKDALVASHLWWALCLGAPVGQLLGEDLAGESVLSDYIIRSGTYAQALLISKTKIFFGPGQTLQAGQFLQQYLAFAKDNELDGYQQVNYVKKQVETFRLPKNFQPWLLELLSMYLHLRECDFIDYRGFLAEAGVKEKMYDWKRIMTQDIDENMKEDIKRYLQIVQRPTWIKMQMLNAIESTPWKTEPYLSRAFQLNDIYEDVYNPEYAPLVYFDEESGEFKVNKRLPKTWNMSREFI
ncbi:MAG: hypothetical protein WC862_05350 [Patescibacteria group bacterium]